MPQFCLNKFQVALWVFRFLFHTFYFRKTFSICQETENKGIGLKVSRCIYFVNRCQQLVLVTERRWHGWGNSQKSLVFCHIRAIVRFRLYREHKLSWRWKTESVLTTGQEVSNFQKVLFRLQIESVQTDFTGRDRYQKSFLPMSLVDGRVAGHLGPAVGLKTLSIHVCVCPHFGM